jgi:hypothetical protein
MPAIVLWLLAMMALVLESVLLGAFGFAVWSLQVPIAVTLYIGLKREFVSGALTLSALVLPIEWLVGGAMGFYSLGLVVLFFLMRLFKGNLQGRWGFAHAVLAAASVWMHGLVMMFGMFLLHSGSPMIPSVFWSMWAAALTTSLTTVMLGRFFDRVDGAFDPRGGRGSLTYDF